MNEPRIKSGARLLVVFATALALVATLTTPVQAASREVRISWGSDASDRIDCPSNARCYNLAYELIGDFDPVPYSLECWVNGRKGWSGQWSGRPHTACYYWGQGVRASVVIDGVRSNEIVLGQPQPPKNLRTSKIDHNSFRITWSPPQDDGGSSITGYSVTVSRPRLSSSVGPWSRTYTHRSNSRSRTLNGRSGAEYTVTVRALNAIATSDPVSDTHRNGDPPSTRPGAPLNAKVLYHEIDPDTNYFRSLKITWDPPADDGGTRITGYTVKISRPRLSSSIGPWERTYTHSSTNRSRTFKGRADKKATYTIEIAARNRIGTGQYVDGQITTYPEDYDCDIPWWDIFTQCALAPAAGTILE